MRGLQNAMTLPPQTYLFAYEFSDTLMLLTNTKVIFYSSIKKRMLRKLRLIRTTEMIAAVCLSSLERLVLGVIQWSSAAHISHRVCSAVDILRQLAPKSDADYKGLKLEFVEKTKGSNDEALATLWDAMKASKQGACVFFIFQHILNVCQLAIEYIFLES
jgi:hypothetical protein